MLRSVGVLYAPMSLICRLTTKRQERLVVLGLMAQRQLSNWFLLVLETRVSFKSEAMTSIYITIITKFILKNNKEI
ncbi:MAG: hypothetical protein JKX87_00535 [Cycloclasticus sp.]|nr:hypothetical protein [Cycloclasticus sp.]